MTREDRNFEGTEFKTAVYDETGMAKKNVSARVPPQVADGLDEYAEAWNLNRTDAMTVLLQFALEESPDPRQMGQDVDLNPAERVYTVELDPENAEYLEGSDVDPSEGINRLMSIYSG